MEEPEAEIAAHMSKWHGIALCDDYHWMLDTESSHFGEHLANEQRYAATQLRDDESLQKTIAAEILSRRVSDSPSSPTRNGPWWYFTRKPAGLDYLQYWRSPVVSADHNTASQTSLDQAQMLIDGNLIQQEYGNFSLGPFRPNPQHSILAFGIDISGDERFDISFKHLDANEILPDRIELAHYTCAWFADGLTLLYVTADELNRPNKVWKHHLGSSQAEDELLLEEADPRVWLTVGATRSGDYLFVRGAATTSTEYHLIDAHDVNAKPFVVRRREIDLYYEVDHRRQTDGKQHLCILNNRSGPNFELAMADINDPDDWVTLIEHNEVRRLHWAMAFNKGIVVYARTGGHTLLLLVDNQLKVREVEFDKPGAIVSPASNPWYETDSFRVSYTSPTTPPSIATINLRDGAMSVIDQMPVGPSLDGCQYSPDDYVAEELLACGDDDVQIPITLVRRADLAPGTPRPCVLYAYGAYERSADMGFSVNRLSLLDRGFTYAVAHVRGGGELGKDWHRQGQLAKKMNSINDYLACARHLCEQGFTSPGLIVGRSSSAGGIVIGAALNFDPDLFGAVVLTAPFVDPLNSLLDPSRYLTVPEWEELGNPVEDVEAFKSILSYSPYENIVAQDYPPVLAIAGTEDVRVSIAEPARWISRLRATATGGPFILLPEFGTGHRGPSASASILERDALTTAWILRVMANAGESHS